MSSEIPKKEKSSVSVDNFWMSVDKKLNNEKMERIKTDYDLTLADEVSQQMSTYVRSTTTRVTKRFLDSRKISSPERSTKWDIEDDENKTQMYQENQEIFADVGNNPLYVTEHIEKDEATNTFASMMSFSNILNNPEIIEVESHPTSTISTTPRTPRSYKVSNILNDSSNEVKLHSTPKTPTTPPPPSSHNYEQPRFITNNEYMDMIWSPWQFDAIICDIDIEEKLISLFEKEKKAKKKSSLSYGIVDLNDSRIMDVLGQSVKFSVKFYFDAEMKKYKPQRAVSEGALETLKCLNVTSLSELGKALSSITINYENPNRDKVYLRHLFEKFFFLFKDKSILNLDSSELQEGWYNSNIDAPFFDDCLASLNDCILRRGEVASKAQKLLRIKSPKTPKYDGVLSFTRKIEFIYVETATTSILSKRDKDLSKLHESIAIMFKLMVSSLPEKIVYEISDLPILCIQFCGKQSYV
ncbi:hypothetical protein C1645_741215 [Glomus cerebriforme]|uniref:Uncharacterized protein n=1 Tax=Glomus cerebriforme TaxID=658196 RepID=A0A397SIR3_9GLOM|nr:hypothetical protein C1645_741215 [Glomus cerebriforme]